jgi:hypothetical protein
MPQPATISAKPSVGAKVKDAIDHLRSNAQELHKSISDAAAKRNSATKARSPLSANKPRPLLGRPEPPSTRNKETRQQFSFCLFGRFEMRHFDSALAGFLGPATVIQAVGGDVGRVDSHAA